MKKLLIIPALFAVFAAIGILHVHATEITGTLTMGAGGGTPDNSSTGGSMDGQVVGGNDGGPGGSTDSGSAALASSGGGSSESSGSSISAPRSQTHHGAAAAVQDDGSLAQASDYTGTGGGYDPALDTYLASLNPFSPNQVSAAEAVAYNKSVGGSANAQNLAGVGGASASQKTMVMAMISLVIAGLAGYAAHVYMGYRREGL